MRAGPGVSGCQAFIIQATFFVAAAVPADRVGASTVEDGSSSCLMSVAMSAFALGGLGRPAGFPRADRPARHRRRLVAAVALLIFLDPKLSGLGLRDRPGAARRRPLGLLASQVGNVIMSSGRTKPRRRGRWAPGDSAQPRCISRARVVAPPPRHARVEFHQRGPSKHVASRLSQVAGDKRCATRASTSCPPSRSNKPPRRPGCPRTRPPRSWPATPTPNSARYAPDWPSSLALLALAWVRRLPTSRSTDDPVAEPDAIPSREPAETRTRDGLTVGVSMKSSPSSVEDR